MSNFPLVENLGLTVYAQTDIGSVVYAEDLERILGYAQRVYGHFKQGKPNWWGPTENGQFDDTHTAFIVGITPIKKKTKAEAALEFVSEVNKGKFNGWKVESVQAEAKRILEMKDEV